MSPLSAAERSRQALATAARPLRTLPASWWDEETAVAMSDWIKRNAPSARRPARGYGRPKTQK